MMCHEHQLRAHHDVAEMQGNAAISDTSMLAGLHSCDIRECKLERAVCF